MEWAISRSNGVKGIVLPGSRQLIPKSWIKRFLLLFPIQEKHVAVFEISHEDAQNGYYVGFTKPSSPNMVSERLLHGHFFRMEIDSDDTCFFAVDSNGNEVRLTHRTTEKKCGTFHKEPLL